MSDPYLLLGWALLALLAFVYVGAVVQLWSTQWGSRRDVAAWRTALAVVLALTWPFALGCTVILWIEQRR